ncbi:PilN domain-containing protein [Candidatus Sumerlaeota bacterium]
MIRINLLPEDQRRRRKARASGPATDGVSPLIVIVLILAFIGLGALGFNQLWQPYRAAVAEDELIDKELADLKVAVQDKRDKFGDLYDLERRVTDHLEVLNVLDPPNRLLWTEKLNIISDLRPENIYITQLKVTESVDQVETVASRRAIAEWDEARESNEPNENPRPKPVKVPIITQELTLNGVSYLTEQSENPTPDEIAQAIGRILTYQEVLTEHRPEGIEPAASTGSAPPPPSPPGSFMHRLAATIDFGGSETEKIGGRTGVTFEFIMKTKPILSRKEPGAES